MKLNLLSLQLLNHLCEAVTTIIKDRSPKFSKALVNLKFGPDDGIT